MASRPSKESTKRKVVIVEDDMDLRNILRRALVAEGHEVMAFGEGASVLSLLDTMSDALFVFDLQVPRANGVELCAAVRRRIGETAPILVLTGMRDSRVCRRLLEEGADDYVVKPVAINAFLERVNRLWALADAGRLAETRENVQRRIGER